MEDLTEPEAFMRTLSNIRHDIPFREDLNRKDAQSYQEFLECAGGFNNVEKTGKLARNKASQWKNPPNSNVDQSVGRQNIRGGEAITMAMMWGEDKTRIRTTQNDNARTMGRGDHARCRSMIIITILL